MWDLSCLDWEERLRSGKSLIPDLPLNQSEADLGLAFFDELQLPDVRGKPSMRDACGQWFRDIVRTVHGSWDPVAEYRFIRDILLLSTKGSSKTTNGAGLALSIMLMNQRPRAEGLFIGPTQAISDRAYEQTVGMIDESKALKRRFRPRDHIKTIEDLSNHSEMKVKTFDVNILTGSILIFALLDELHLLGRNSHTAKVLRQIRGGLDKTPEGLLLITTTQSDDQPAGAFKDELHHARKIRDGAYRGRNIRPMLPVLYEFPESIARSKEAWQDITNWPMVMPNLGRSVHLDTLVPDWESEKTKGEHAIRIWASQHLNIEIGVGMKSDAWMGAAHWEKRADNSITPESMLKRCEVIVIGIDGGGLDDLFGLTLLGREPIDVEYEVDAGDVDAIFGIDTDPSGRKENRRERRWLSWSHAWCHKDVLTRRQSIKSFLEGFAEDGDLTIVGDELADLSAIVAIVQRVKDAGLLHCVAVDPAGLGEIVDALSEIGVKQENQESKRDFLAGVSQGYALMNAIKTGERRLARGSLLHAKQPIMDWCVGNLKIEPTATAIRATKQNAGDAKIDPATALFDAITVMSMNPPAASSVYETREMMVL